MNENFSSTNVKGHTPVPGDGETKQESGIEPPHETDTNRGAGCVRRLVVPSENPADQTGLTLPVDPLEEAVVVANALLAVLKMWDKWDDETVYESIKTSMFNLRMCLPKEYKKKLNSLTPITIRPRSLTPVEQGQNSPHQKSS